jgi:hypothetical protein
MQEPHQTLLTDEGEETLVTPRFDEEETIVARRVVPLADDGRIASLRAAWTRPSLLALALVSTLVGVVMGGAGLYFYQSRRAAPPVVSATQNVSAPPEPAPTQPAPTLEVPMDAQEQPVAPATSDGAKDEAAAREADAKKEADRDAVPAKRKDSGDQSESAGTKRQGKKGDADADQTAERPRRVVYDTQGPIPEDSSPAAQRARRVEEGLRRAERIRERQRRRRERAARSSGSIESIFEGQP